MNTMTKVWLESILYLTLFCSAFADEKPEDCIAEVNLRCPSENLVINGFASKSPFFGDALSPKCYNFDEKMFGEEETSNTFISEDGMSLIAECENDNEIIVSFSLCIEDAHVSSITLQCSPLKDSDKKGQVRQESSETFKHAFVDCGVQAAIQKIQFSDSGDGIVTKVELTCVDLQVAENEDI